MSPLLRSIQAAMVVDFPTCSLDRFDQISQRILKAVEDATRPPVEDAKSLPTSLGPLTLQYLHDAASLLGGR